MEGRDTARRLDVRADAGREDVPGVVVPLFSMLAYRSMIDSAGRGLMMGSA